VRSALQTVKPWLPVIAYMAMIVLASAQSRPPIDMDDLPLRDKGAHFLEYAVLAILIANALTTRHLRKGESLTRGAGFKLSLWTIGLSTIWGYLDELHQAFVPGRFSDSHDLLADFLGSIAGAAIYFTVRLAIARKRSSGVTAKAAALSQDPP
jgi:VanZ family protein